MIKIIKKMKEIKIYKKKMMKINRIIINNKIFMIIINNSHKNKYSHKYKYKKILIINNIRTINSNKIKKNH